MNLPPDTKPLVCSSGFSLSRYRPHRRPPPDRLKPALRTNRTRQLAFTLLELMIVLVLIGIASAMIVPAMHGTYEDALLRSTARKLVDVFNLANSRAVTLNQPFRVRLDTKEGKYSLEPIKIPRAQTT